MRDALAEAILELGTKDRRIVVLGADTSVSIKTSLFGERFPERFFNVGIAESNMIGIASGLALAGKIPVVSTYSAFVPGKCLDQIRNAVAYPNLNVKIVSSHGGLTVGPDGASHQTIEDVAVMRAIPHMHVVIPADAPSARELILKAASTPGPFYMRLSRPNVATVHESTADLEIGKAALLRDGSDVTIVACGIMLSEAMIAAENLSQEGISAEIIDCHTVKPLDNATLGKSAAKTGAVITAEEHNIIGGLGGAVAEALSESRPVRIERVGVRDTFGESGEHSELLVKYGLTSREIAKAARRLVRGQSA
ncbi:transketolase family protein [Candidatus Bathyarchaeota archaeon]|nr:MAG: transketolase family protein [Candidatus Bathyarchaeota archaeon]